MAFGIIKADTLTHSTAGSVDTKYAVNGSSKAWCYFDGTQSTLSLDNSLNGSSLTDVTTGQYDLNLTSSMANLFFPVMFMASDRNDNKASVPITTGSCRMLNRTGIDGATASDNDDDDCQCSLHGDLA